MRLTQSQIAFYRTNGYLVVENVIPASDIAALRDVVADFREASKHVVASDDVFDMGPGHSADDPKLRRIKDPVHRHLAFDALMRSDPIVELVAPLLGGTVRFDHSKLNFKPVGGTAKIAWHQDWAFYPHTNDSLLAVGVMLEDCTRENGPLKVVPGSHKGPVYDHHRGGYFVGGIDESVLGEVLERAVALTAPAGSISMHHVRTLHASGENRSDRERPLLLYSYAAADAFPVGRDIDLDAFDRRLIVGQPTVVPRATGVPMRLPFPRRPGADSIFDNQKGMTAA